MTTLMQHLAQLETSGLIRLAQVEPDLEYLFRHALVQDAAYASLLGADRKRLHRVVGEAVELLYSDRTASREYATMLARHFQRAGEDRRALTYYLQAGEAALSSYANQEAESLYRSALTLPCSQAQHAALLSGLGEALYRQSHFEEALGAWRQGIELSQALGDHDGVARLYTRSARAAWYANDTPQGLRLCQEGLEAVAGAADSPDLARLVHEAARAYHFNGLPDQARPLCQQALEMAEQAGAVDVRADTLTTMALLPNQPADEILAALRKAVELSESAGLLEIAGRASHNLGIMTATHLGDLRTSRDYLLKAVDLARQRGTMSEALPSWTSAIGHSLSLGELAAAESALTELENQVSRLPDPDTARLELNSMQAGLLSTKGEWAESLRLARMCQAEARQRGNLQMVLGTSTELAWLLLELHRFGEMDDWEEVEASLEEAIELGDRGLGSKVWPLCLLSMAHTRRGRPERARQILAEASESASAHPSAWDEQSIRIAEAQLALAEGWWSEALTLTEAVATFQIKQERRWQWARTLLEWAEIHVQRAEPGDLERVQTLVREARAAFRDMGASRYAALCDDRLHALRAETHARAAAHDKVARELAIARRIQEGLLPEEVPEIPGWQLAVTLEPARETSGDFYDFVSLRNGHLGIVVADVADKGAGAALYMALSRTLIRTYATEYIARPEKVLAMANRRILTETHTDMFVTVFYGVLDPHTGTLTYCNAGHHPPYVLSVRRSQTLGRTGMALGVVHDTDWDSDTVQLAPEEILLLYTDGVTDAQSPDGMAFGQDRLLAVAQASLGRAAQEVQEELLAGLRQFVQNAPQFDDLTLLVLKRT